MPVSKQAGKPGQNQKQSRSSSPRVVQLKSIRGQGGPCEVIESYSEGTATLLERQTQQTNNKWETLGKRGTSQSKVQLQRGFQSSYSELHIERAWWCDGTLEKQAENTDRGEPCDK